ncbi:MAG: hypothetical protein QNK23_05830 [Crocinitomicaceae bacterium]|nr:hypothetical protein [Crocinitomicaceae bacterium]
MRWFVSVFIITFLITSCSVEVVEIPDDYRREFVGTYSMHYTFYSSLNGTIQTYTDTSYIGSVMYGDTGEVIILTPEGYLPYVVSEYGTISAHCGTVIGYFQNDDFSIYYSGDPCSSSFPGMYVNTSITGY